MATVRDVLEGLKVLAEYDDESPVCAAHDEILAGPPIGGMTHDHVQRLKQYGWRFDPTEQCWRRFT